MRTFSSLEHHYFSLLQERYSDRHEALAEALLMESALELPKPTEHFVSDLHGEYIAFNHVLRNASGVLRRYIDELFPEKSKEERAMLATILYYPEKKLADLKEKLSSEEYRRLLKGTLADMIVVAKRVATKYDHAQIERTFPKNRKKLLNLLLLEDPSSRHKKGYVNALYDNMIAYGEAEFYIKDLADLSVRYVVEKVHIIGDIYDRGEEAEKIMDHVLADERIDIQWGNHDIAWIGAACGNFALAANVIRIALRYNVLSTIEDGYGINLLPLLRYAEHYRPEKPFYTKNPGPDERINESIAKLHKAMAILQFKAEGQLIHRHPEYAMANMLHLDQLNLKEGTVTVEGKVYPLLDDHFPTVDGEDPYAFTAEEAEVAERIRQSFMASKRLQHHIRHMIEVGSMYRIENGNLLFHGCIPMTEDGQFVSSSLFGESLKGRELLDAMDEKVRDAFYKRDGGDVDFLFYLWCGKTSPLFGKERITTFERYFIADEETHVERKNPYYQLRESEKVADSILAAFGIDDPRGKIINGHTPVKKRKGESPVKAGGKVVVIDGGFAHAYRKTTGTAGYTLISNSYGILLATHDALQHEEAYIQENLDITSSLEFIAKYDDRRLVKDTDEGKRYGDFVEDLKTLAERYDRGKRR